LAGEKEVRAENVLGPLGLRGDGVNVEVGRVRGEDRAGLGDFVKPFEDRLLEVHVLECRFDHEVGVIKRIEVKRRRELAHPLLDLGNRHAALLGRVLVVATHDRNATVERLFRGLDDGDGNAGAQEIHGNAAAHGAGADHADLGDLPDRRVGGNVGDLRRLPLGEKDVALRLGLGCDDQLAENRALPSHALVERQIDRVLDRLDRLLPGLKATVFSRIGLADGVEDLWMAARRLEPVGSVADFLQGRLLGNEAPSEGDCGVAQLSLLGELVDDPPFPCLAGAKRRPGQDDVKRLLRPNEAGQALGATGAGDDAEVDFRQAAFRRWDGDAVVRRQRDFESAAERRSVQRRDDRLRGVFHCVERLRKVRWGRGLAEFGNVGACDERPAVADDDDRLDRAVRFRRFDASLEALSDGLRQSVHWRRVDRNQRDFAFDRKVNDRIDGGHGVFPLWRARPTPVMMARPGLLIGDDRI